MVKHTQTIRLLPTICLSVFDHLVGLALKGLKWSISKFREWWTTVEEYDIDSVAIDSENEKT